jgi:hypothetical protein
VCRGRSNACNPLAPRIDKNLGNPVVKKVWARTLADCRGIRLLSVNIGRHVRQRWKEPAPSAVQTQDLKMKVSPRLKATVGLMKIEAIEFAMISSARAPT